MIFLAAHASHLGDLSGASSSPKFSGEFSSPPPVHLTMTVCFCLVVQHRQTHRCIYVYLLFFLFVQPINNTNLRLSPGSEHTLFWYSQALQRCGQKCFEHFKLRYHFRELFCLWPAIGFWPFHVVVHIFSPSPTPAKLRFDLL